MAETVVINYRDIIKNQPTVNIGTIGSVSHGKSSLVRSITNIRTQKHSKEQEKNLTIHIGYANAKIFRCSETGFTCATNTNVQEMINPENGKPMELIKHISFVDCPGHESFMSTMISGTTVMDSAMLVIAGNDKVVPEPQTYEHLLAISNTNINNILVLQNKLDLVTKDECVANLNKIMEFLRGSIAENSPIIPTSVQYGINIQPILQYIVNDIPDPVHDYERPAQMIIIRSFDVNKPGEEIDVLQGGVVGGSLKQGIFHIDDYIEIRPGIIMRDETGFKCRPLISKIKSLQSENQKLTLAVPGGLIGVCTTIDPMFTRDNNMVGHIIGHIGTLPKVYQKISVKYKYFKRDKIKKMKSGEKVILCTNAMTINCVITNVRKSELKHTESANDLTNELITDVKSLADSTNNLQDLDEYKKVFKIVELKLDMPICVNSDINNPSTVAIFRKIDNSWKLSCHGLVIDGEEVTLELPSDYDQRMKEFKPKITKIIYEKVYNPNKYTYDYNVLMENIKFKSSEKYVMALDAIQIDYINKSTIINNFEYLYKTIDLSPKDDTVRSKYNFINIRDHLFNFILTELSATGSINARNQMIINRKYKQDGVQKVIKNYLMSYIACRHCKVPKCFLIKKNKLMIQHCDNCLAETSIDV